MQANEQPEAIDEATLILEFRQGEARAMKSLFQLYWRGQCFFARSILTDPEASEDIVADVFLQLWKLRDDFHSLPSVRSFLYTATRNACLNYLRSSRRADKRHKEYTYMNELPFQDGEVQEVIKTELIGKLLDAIELLPNQYRKVMQLTAEGLATEDIARALQLSPKVVRNYKSRAVSLLRKDLTNNQLFLAVGAALLEGWLR